MTKQELCESIYKRAFYHAYNSYFLQDKEICIIYTVQHNRAFFYESKTPKYYRCNKHHEYYSTIMVTFNDVPPNAEQAKAMMNRYMSDDDKQLIKTFIDDFNQNDKYVEYDLYEELFWFIKRYLRHVYESYVESFVNEKWFNFTSTNVIYTDEIRYMMMAFDDDVKRIWPDQYVELMKLVLNDFALSNINVDADHFDKNELMELLANSGLFEAVNQ